jgi:hypothetical protein
MNKIIRFIVPTAITILGFWAWEYYDLRNAEINIEWALKYNYESKRPK